MKKIFIFLLFFISIVKADLLLEGINEYEGLVNYRESLFNEKIQISPGCKNISEIYKEIENKVGYSVVDHTNIDESKPICSLSKFGYIGDVLDAIYQNKKIVYYVATDYRILVEYASSYTSVFPMNWNIENSTSQLRNKYPELKWYYYGTTVRVEGKKDKVDEVSNTINNLRTWATREIPFKIKISKLNTQERNGTYIIARKVLNPDRQFLTSIKHSNILPINEINSSISFNLQTNQIFLEDKFIYFSQIKELSFLKNGYQITFSPQSFFNQIK